MSAPADLFLTIKEDLGICGGSEHDAWLQRRIEGVWSRMEHYTARSLAAPPISFMDDWTRISRTNTHYPLPPALCRTQGSTVFLRHFPVAGIEAVEINGVAADPTGVSFDPRSGKLFALYGPPSQDLSGALYNTRITYRAGWDTIPGDLYEVVLGAVATQYASRAAAGASGAPPGSMVTGITVADVGSLEVAPGGNAFVNATMKGVSTTDPILGPYVSTLDLYVDQRSLIGHALLPVTEPVPVTP